MEKRPWWNIRLNPNYELPLRAWMPVLALVAILALAFTTGWVSCHQPPKVEREKVVLRKIVNYRFTHGKFPVDLAAICDSEEVKLVYYSSDGHHFILAPRSLSGRELPVSLLNDAAQAMRDGGREKVEQVIFSAVPSDSRWIASDLFVPTGVELYAFTINREHDSSK